MASGLKTLVAAGVMAIGGLVVAGPARAQYLPPNGNPGPFPPRPVCRHIGPCSCPRPWYAVPGWGYGYGPAWGYGYGNAYGRGWGYGVGGHHTAVGHLGGYGGHVGHYGRRR
jgi:hypothetical protein